MAVRRPLYAAAGRLLEIPDSDSLPTALVPTSTTSPLARLVLPDDFAPTGTTRIGQWGWSPQSSPTVTEIPGEDKHPGIVQIATSTTVNDFGGISFNVGAVGIILPAQVDYFVAVVRIPTITSMVVRVGLANSAAALLPTNGMYFEYVAATSTFWRSVSMASGSPSAGNTTVTVTANNWYQLKFVRNANGTWTSSINGVDHLVHSTAIPTAALQPVVIVGNTTAAVRSAQLDYFEFTSIPLGQRWT